MTLNIKKKYKYIEYYDKNKDKIEYLKKNKAVNRG